jgi:hypothetical protein
MNERLYRTQILLEPEQHRLLSQIAQRQRRSLSDVVREIVRQHLDEQNEARRERMAAFEQIEKHRAKIMAGRGGKPITVDLNAIIEEIREEQVNELTQVALRRSD